MVLYRRNRIPGGTYFFTVTLADRSSTALTQHIDALRDAVMRTRSDAPFSILATVVMPDHLHAVWRLPQGDDQYSMRWRAIKSRFTAAMVSGGNPITRRPGGERCLWARRFWEHTIRDEEDLHRHVDYVHFNPVKHGLVQRVADWPHSSFHRFVKRGWLTIDWGGGPSDEVSRAGE